MPSTSPQYDLLVIGGGIHGVGVLQAAAAAGLKAVLLERKEIAAGTSSRSSKLIHGGLRYLESGQLRLVRESLRERELLLRLAPQLVRLVPFWIPIYGSTTRAPWKIRAGLTLYALLGGLGEHARFGQVPRPEWSTLDGLRLEDLRAVFRYYDAQTDDALLTRAVLASALELGAELMLPAELIAAHYENKAWSVEVAAASGAQQLRASVLVNAAGPWASQVLARIRGAPAALAVELVGGTHIELEGPLERGIYYVEAPSDRRAVFCMPWRGHTLVGTTEVPWRAEPDAHTPSASEIEYLEQTYAHYFPEHPRRRLTQWAGLRVLPQSSERAFGRPREVMLQVDAPAAPRLLTMYGGKLTGYRLTAEKVLQRLSASLPKCSRRAHTGELTLSPPQTQTHP